MVRTDAGDFASQEILPQRILGWNRTQCRRAFGQWADALEILFGECKIMRASLARDVHAQFFCRGDQSDARSTAYMDDMQPAARFTGEFERFLNGLEFGVNGARLQIRSD